jgi:DNA-binding response OmpR family regulator
MKEEYDIFVVDDDEDIRMMLETMLKFHRFRTRTFSNPADMLQHLGLHSAPRVIIMDMLLSGYDGRDYCRKLKADMNSMDIPVLMISAHPDAGRTCTEAGADAFIAKPFEMDHLIGTIRSLMNKELAR